MIIIFEYKAKRNIINIVVNNNSNDINCDIKRNVPIKLYFDCGIIEINIKIIIDKLDRIKNKIILHIIEIVDNGDIIKNKENEIIINNRGKRLQYNDIIVFGIIDCIINKLIPFIIDDNIPYIPILNGPILLCTNDIINSSINIKKIVIISIGIIILCSL